MVTPMRHASSPILTAHDITWAQFICKSGESTALAAPTPLVDRDLPTDTRVLTLSLSFFFPTGFRNVLRMESKRCLRSWPLLSFFRKKKSINLVRKLLVVF